MNRPQEDIRLLRAFGDLCNGTISADEGVWLERRIVSDAGARAAYVDYMAMHANLLFSDCEISQPQIAGSTNPDSKPAVESVDSMLEPIAESLPHPALDALSAHTELPVDEFVGLAPTPRRSDDRHTKRSGFYWGFIAASLVGVAVSASFLTHLVSSGALSGMLADEVKPTAVAVARVTGTHNCLWENGARGIGYGSELHAGQELELVEGLAEITFIDGATVLLEGPARFDVGDRHEVGLLRGRLSAVVPKRARGFRVHTRALEVYDVGTEFGLLARESGAAEVHVFNGLLKAEVLGVDGTAQRRVELNASEAIRVSPVSTSMTSFPADEEAFVRSLLPKSGPQDGLLAYEGYDYPVGPLSAQNGGFGWAGPWFSISEESEGLNTNSVGGGSLSVESLVPKGNHASLSGQSNRIRRSLATSVGGVFDVAGLVENQDGVRLIGRDGQRVYLSFLQRVTKTDDGFYGLELHRGDGNGNRVLCIGNGAEGTGYGATSNYNIYGAQNFPSLGVENDETNLFIVKITFGVKDKDLVEVFRNPASLRDEQACRPDVTLRGNFAFDRISLGNFDGDKTLDADEIRVGTHYLAVTGRWGRDRGRLLRRVTWNDLSRRNRGVMDMPLFVAVDYLQPSGWGVGWR